MLIANSTRRNRTRGQSRNSRVAGWSNPVYRAAGRLISGRLSASTGALTISPVRRLENLSVSPSPLRSAGAALLRARAHGAVGVSAHSGNAPFSK